MVGEAGEDHHYCIMVTVAIIPAAGSGKRLGFKLDKPFVRLAKKPIIAYCLEVLESSPYIDAIIVATRKRNLGRLRRLIKRYNFKKIKDVVIGGETRFESVRNCLKKVNPSCDVVLVHDACRPFLSHDFIRKSVRLADKFGGCCVSVKEGDTLKVAGEDLFIRGSLDRSAIWRAQTPQTFRRSIIAVAYKAKIKDSSKVTDDSSLVENLKKKVKILHGSYKNIKITTKEDLKFAEAILNLEKKYGR